MTDEQSSSQIIDRFQSSFNDFSSDINVHVNQNHSNVTRNIWTFLNKKTSDKRLVKFSSNIIILIKNEMYVIWTSDIAKKFEEWWSHDTLWD